MRVKKPAVRYALAFLITVASAIYQRLSGPTYPETYNVFDGQGIPDAFQPALGADRGGTALGIGVGLVDTKAGMVLEYAPWNIERREGALSFSTSQRSTGVVTGPPSRPCSQLETTSPTASTPAAPPPGSHSTTSTWASARCATMTSTAAV